VNAIDRAVCDLMTASLQTFWPVRHPLHPELSKHELGERQTVLIQNDKKQRSKPTPEPEGSVERKRDGVADSLAGRGESEEWALLRLALEARNERTPSLLRKKAPPARPIPLNGSG